MIISLNRGRTNKCYINWSYYSGHREGLICHPLSHQIPPNRLFLKDSSDVGSVPKFPPHTTDISSQGRTTCVPARLDDHQLCVCRVMWLSELGRHVSMAVMQYILTSYSFWPSLQNRELQHRQKDQLGGLTEKLSGCRVILHCQTRREAPVGFHRSTVLDFILENILISNLNGRLESWVSNLWVTPM